MRGVLLPTKNLFLQATKEGEKITYQEITCIKFLHTSSFKIHLRIDFK